MDNLSPSQIKQMIELLQSMLPKENIETPPKTSSRKNNKKDTNKKFINKFDTMTEAALHKEDKRIDEILSVHPPTPRTRKFDLIDATCRICGKKESINPVFLDAQDRYKCNSCSRSSG
jgi:hypothetical protein